VVPNVTDIRASPDEPVGRPDFARSGLIPVLLLDDEVDCARPLAS
jgi:hypothetical protein